MGKVNSESDFNENSFDLKEMLDIFGNGFEELPEETFRRDSGFHCGFMTTDKSQAFLNYQKYTLDDYFNAVRKKVAFSRFFVTMFKPIAQKYLLHKSHYYKEYIKDEIH